MSCTKKRRAIEGSAITPRGFVSVVSPLPRVTENTHAVRHICLAPLILVAHLLKVRLLDFDSSHALFPQPILQVGADLVDIVC